jgi:hypothetical protein
MRKTFAEPSRCRLRSSASQHVRHQLQIESETQDLSFAYLRTWQSIAGPYVTRWIRTLLLGYQINHPLLFVRDTANLLSVVQVTERRHCTRASRILTSYKSSCFLFALTPWLIWIDPHLGNVHSIRTQARNTSKGLHKVILSSRMQSRRPERGL